MATRSLPIRGQSSAPKFDGEPRQLTRYFQDLEAVFQAHAVNAVAERVRLAKHYAELSEEETFNSIDPAQLTDWDNFKTAVIKEYPGADDDRRYALSDLESVVAKWGAKDFEDRDQVGEYYREFNRVAHFLIDKGRLSSQQRDKMFPNAFTGDLRQRLDARLQILHPNVHPDDGYAIAQTRDAAVFLVGGGGAATGNVSGSKTSRVKQESLSIDSVRGLIRDELGSTIQRELAATLATLGVGNTSGGGAAAPSGYGGGYGAAPGFRRQGCHFCSDVSHMIRDCPVVEDYIRRQLVGRDGGGRLTLPSGAQLPVSFPGRNFKEKLDSYHRAQTMPTVARDPPPHMTAQTHFLGEVGLPEEPEGAGAEVMLLKDRIVELLAKEAVATGRKVKFDGVEVPVLRPALKRPGPPGIRVSDIPAPTRAPARTLPPSNTHNPVAGTDGTFKYQSPLEVSGLDSALLERLLATEVPVRIGELLGAAAGVRKAMKEKTTAKRIPVSAAYVDDNAGEMERTEEVLFQAGDVERAKVTVPLRSVYPIIDNRLSPECVLDPGSMIVAMRKDIWQELGSPLDPEGRMTMQSANKQLNTTLGVVHDLPFVFGPVTLKLHVQVLEEAPFEVLLGRPFFQLGRTNFVDHDEGESYLTIRDPATKKTVTIPTKERVRAPAKPAGQAFIDTLMPGAITWNP